MSEKLSALKKKGGGKPKEVDLWTNASPTSSFASQTVTLPNAVTGVDTIRMYYRVSTTVNSILYCDIPISNFSKSTYQGLYSIVGGVGMCRPFTTISSTQISFGTAYKLNTTSTDASAIIPTKICKLI